MNVSMIKRVGKLGRLSNEWMFYGDHCIGKRINKI